MGLRPISTILDNVGVPKEVSIPAAGDRAMSTYHDTNLPLPNSADQIIDPHTQLTVPSANNITIPNTSLTTPSVDTITIPDTQLTTSSATNINIPNTQLTTPATDKIIIPNIVLDSPKGNVINIPDNDIKSKSQSALKTPDNNIQIPKSNIISTLDVNVGKSRQNAIKDPKVVLGTMSGNGIINPDIVLTTPSGDKIINPDIKLLEPKSDLTIDPGTVLGVPSGDMIVNPNIITVNPNSNVMTIPNIITDAVNPDVTTIPNIVLGLPNADNIINPNTVLGGINSNVMTIPNIGLSTPNSNVITIPNTALGTINNNLITIPNIVTLSPTANLITNPNTVLGGMTINPHSMADNDLIKEKYINSPDVLSQSSPFSFRKNFNNKDNPDSAFSNDKIGKSLDELYEKRQATFKHLDNSNFSISWNGYGNDQPGGGSSNQPYVTRQIGQTWGPANSNFLLSMNRGIWDGIRVGKWMLDGSNGVLFTAKQVGLQMMNPKMETTAAQRVFLPVISTRIYNPLKLPLQVAGLPLGMHMPRHGILPDPPLGYSEINALNNRPDNYKNFMTGGNRLLMLYSELIDGSSVYMNGTDDPMSGWTSKPYDAVKGVVNKLKDKVNKLIPSTGLTEGLRNEFKFASNLLGSGGKLIKELSGLAGPKSVMGIGWTDHYSYKKNFEISWTNQNGATITLKNAPYRPIEGGRYPEVAREFENGSILAQSLTDDFGPGATAVSGITGITDNTFIVGAATKYQKLRDLANGNANEQSNNASPGFNAHNFDSLWTDSTGAQSADNGKRNSYPLASKAGKGTMRHALGDDTEGAGGLWPDMYARVGVQDTGEGQIDKLMADIAPNSFNDLGRDFVSVRFKRYDSSLSDGVITFRAYITGLSDKWSPEWNSVNYVGRPDKVHTYTGVTRQIGFQLMIAAESHAIMKKVYERINHLARFTMPTFTPGGIMKGPLMIMTIGTLMKDLPGFIDSLNFDFADDYPWDIEVEKPMYAKIDISYTVIGKNIPNAAIRDWYPANTLSNRAFTETSQQLDQTSREA